MTGDIDGPFIDTGSWCPQVDPRIYLHVPLVEQYARELLDMVPADDVEALREAVVNLTDQLEDKDKLLAAYQQVEELTGATT